MPTLRQAPSLLSALLLVGALSLSGCDAPAPTAPKSGPSTSSETASDSTLPADSGSTATSEAVTPPEMTTASDATVEKPAEPQPTKAKTAEAKPLFDGKTMENWTVTDFGGQGEVTIEEGAFVLQQGSDLTGISWAGDALPKVNYELTLEARRIDGGDFFCGIVFPIGDQYCSFVVGGWGGGVVGLSSVDGIYASENETATFHTFKQGQWYKIRLRVTSEAVQAWIDGDVVVNLPTKDRKFTVHPAVDLAKPLGISCYATVAGLREIKLQEVTGPDKVEKAE